MAKKLRKRNRENLVTAQRAKYLVNKLLETKDLADFVCQVSHDTYWFSRYNAAPRRCFEEFLEVYIKRYGISII